MTDINQNFEMWQGEDKTIRVNLYNSSGAAYGSLAGLTFTWKVFLDESETSAVISKTTGSGITNNASDYIDIAISKANTVSLDAPVRYYHECRVVDASAKEDVVFVGTLMLWLSPTK
jgi:hypothetical protein